MRVLVLGGTGNFGARIVRALHSDPNIELTAAARNGAVVGTTVPAVTLDAFAADFPLRLRDLAPQLVIHCIGPFQQQSYCVAEAALAAGSHYLDLADGREFVAQFAPANQSSAASAQRVAISGASTLPALSWAVIDVLTQGLTASEVEITIAPGQRAVRGAATLAAVFSYLGRPVLVWRNGQWITDYGWMDLTPVQLDCGRRWSALCDVPDLALVPARYPEVKSVSFHAALEFRVQHLVLWKLAALRRWGMPFPVARWAMALDRLAGVFDGFAGAWGGMRVSVVGKTADGTRLRRTWQLKVPARDGPEIPTFAAILLARRLARGERMVPGAYACLGFITLAEFAAEFARWNIQTRIEEGPA